MAVVGCEIDDGWSAPRWPSPEVHYRNLPAAVSHTDPAEKLQGGTAGSKSERTVSIRGGLKSMQDQGRLDCVIQGYLRGRVSYNP